jgi:5,10-methylene-tetrahydrofolate dehydrogenase/methenyl tetrahydrofolate cyclohydrolase
VIWPLNEHAKTFMENKVEKVDEIGFVEFLYQLRDRNTPADILATITKQ